jgi:hypothetical protein
VPAGSNAVLDFNAGEAFTVTSSTWTFGNANGEAFSISEHFTSASSVGTLHPVPGIDRTNTSRTVYGVPLAQTVQGDLHQVIATVATVAPVRATRQIIANNRTLAARVSRPCRQHGVIWEPVRIMTFRFRT